MFYNYTKRSSFFKQASPIKLLILITAGICLFTALFDRLFTAYFGIYSPFTLLGLSSAGIDHFFYWQWITYIFIHPLNQGLSLSFLLYFAFNIYMLYFIGKTLIEIKGVKSFFALYFGTALVAGLSAYGMQCLLHSPLIFAGNQPVVYSLLIAWLMMYPAAEVRLFLVLPLKAKVMISVILLMTVVVDLSNGDFINFGANFAALAFSYLFSVIAWKNHSPFTSLHRFESKLMNLSPLVKRRKKDSLSGYYKTKIYDFKTGEAIVGDEAFIDAVLTKVSKQGRKSLSLKERWRMRQIARKRKKL